MPKQLSGLDTMFLYLEKARTPLEVSTVQIYDPSTVPGGRVGFEEILATFQARLSRSKVFRRKLLQLPFSLDHPYWIEDGDFDIEYHVRHIALPRPGDWRQLMIQISRLQSQHLDKSRPLWEVYVIEGLDNVKGINKGCFCLFMKMHHATIDGASGQEIQKAIHDLESIPFDGERQNGSGRHEAPEPPATWGLLARSPLNALRKSTRLAYGMLAAAPRLVRAGLQKRRNPGDEIPKTIFNLGRASANRVIDGRFYDLEEVKAISRAIENTKVNDVVLTVIGGAMRKYLIAKGQLPENSLVTAVPINIRDKDGKHAAADNMVSTMNVSLCSDIEDPVKRMHAIHESAKAAKAMTEIVGAGTATELPMNLPAPVAKVLLPATMELMQRSGVIPFNTLITNVAGIQQPLYLAGARMVALMGLIPVADQMGLTHSVFSYDGMISMAFTACREMLPDPAFYTRCLEESYGELRDAALPPREQHGHLLAPNVAGGKRASAKGKSSASKTAARKTTASKPVRKKAVRKKAVAQRAGHRQAAAGETTDRKVLRKKARKKKQARAGEG